MFVYKITNTRNNKIYIGRTVTSVNRRLSNHIYKALKLNKNSPLYRAIRKYGPNVFTIEIIDTATTEEELNEKEIEWINRLHSDNPNHGYNITTTQFMAKSNGQTKYDEQQLQNVRKQISTLLSNEKNPNAQAIKCLNIRTNEELHFKTEKECQQYFNEKTHRFITTRVTHKTRGLYKNTWAIAYENEEYQYEQIVHKRGKKVILTDTKSNEQICYQSIRQLSRELNLNRNLITKQIRNGIKEFDIQNYHIQILD